MEEDLLPLGEAARRLGMTKQSVWGLARRGRLARVQTSLGWGYPRAAVEELAERRARDLVLTGQRGRPRRRQGGEAVRAS
jgi:hypothetical protein